jgi:hypothetical protein
MEDLFSTNIAVNNETVSYHVIFDHEKYVFLSNADNKTYRSFSFKREHDQWVYEDFLPSEIKSQAVDALENYLLRQH